MSDKMQFQNLAGLPVVGQTVDIYYDWNGTRTYNARHRLSVRAIVENFPGKVVFLLSKVGWSLKYDLDNQFWYFRKGQFAGAFFSFAQVYALQGESCLKAPKPSPSE